MQEDYRAITRLPVLTQFLLAPLPALLAALTYTAWHWTQSDWGGQVSRSQGYHQLGWTILPLTGIAGALFLTAVGRGVKGRSSARLLAATLLTVVSMVVLAYARSTALSAGPLAHSNAALMASATKRPKRRSGIPRRRTSKS